MLFLRTRAKLLLQQKKVSAAALALAGVFVFAGAMWSISAGLAGALACMSIALLLAIPALFSEAEAGGEPARSRPWRWVFVLLIVFHAAVAISLVHINRAGVNDCWIFQRDAAESLLRGVDPYGTTHENIYSPAQTAKFYHPGAVVNGRVQVGLLYPPLTLLAAVPGYLLGDIRYGYVLVVLLSALILSIALPGRGGFVAAICLLLNPLTFIIEICSWTEPLVLLLLCWLLYILRRKPALLPVAFGIFLAAKQYNALALPLAGLLLPRFTWKAYCKFVGISLAVAAATLLPFALWNFHALWHDLVQFVFTLPFRTDALSFAVLFPWATKIGPLLLLIFLAFAVLRARPSAANFSAAYGAALLIYFVTSKQACFNYYFLVGHVFLISSACRWTDSGA
jgi:hypothetical protein